MEAINFRTVAFNIGSMYVPTSTSTKELCRIYVDAQSWCWTKNFTDNTSVRKFHPVSKFLLAKVSGSQNSFWKSVLFLVLGPT